jgi:hypothetical protein
MTQAHDFKSRILFDQKAVIEEDKTVFSRMHAVTYTYPGAVTHTTARCRTTVVYEKTVSETLVYGGTIEKWSDKGWQSIEELFDTRLIFQDEEEVQSYMLALYKSFVLGIPIEYKSTTHPPSDMPPTAPNKRDKSPNLRVLKFSNKNSSLSDATDDNYVKDLKNKKDKKKNNNNDDDPDFDWI